MIAFEIIFWFSVLAMFHSYVLYPLILLIFSIGKKENEIKYSENDKDLPEVYVIFSAFNEEKVIREKLESIFNTSYPAEKLHVFIGSDNSTDRTNDIIRSFSSATSEVFFKEFSNRQGKSGVLNELVDTILQRNINTSTTLFVLTDANVIFSRDTIYQLAKHFKNEAIGQVGANILNRGVTEQGISFQEKSYIQRENSIKYLEGLNWGSMMGGFGACHCMRANCWTPIPKGFLMEDFYLSMNVLSKGYKAIKEKHAICYEDVSDEVSEEFKRKTRIQAGNFQNLGVYWKLLLGFNAVAFSFLSHKVLRWMGPIFIVLAYFSNLALLFGDFESWFGQFYLFTFMVQNLMLLTPLIDKLLKSADINLRLLRFVSYFYVMNFALVKGFIMFAQGIETSAWNPTKRNLS